MFASKPTANTKLRAFATDTQGLRLNTRHIRCVNITVNNNAANKSKKSASMQRLSSFNEYSLIKTHHSQTLCAL